MKITELYPDVITEDLNYEYKAVLNPDNPIKELQEALHYRSRSQFLTDVINPLLESGQIYRDGKPKSPKSLIKIKKN